jgi:hypothetical protein
MNPLFVKQLPFFGFLFFALFVLSMIIFFKYRTRISLILYYLGFVTLALGLGEIWIWAGATLERTSTFFEGSYTRNHFIWDQDLGYRLAPGPRRAQSTKRFRSGELIYSVTYTINALGLREVASNDAGPAVLFFGDSFTFGEGVSDADTLPAQFARLSGYSVFNLGVHGYGPHQFLRMLEVGRAEQIGIQKDRAVVIFTLLPSHVERVAGRSTWDQDGPLYQITSAGLSFRGSFHSQSSIANRILEKSYVYKLIESMFSETGDRQRLLAILEKANEIVKHRYGSDMLVITWDEGSLRGSQTNADRAAWIRDNLAKSGIANLTVSQITPQLGEAGYYLAGDGHPSPAAYAALAEALAKYFGLHQASLEGQKKQRPHPS